MTLRPGIKHGLLGVLGGVAVSVLFFPLNLLLALGLVVWLLVRLCRRAAGGRMNHLIAVGAGLAVVAVAILLPVKQLDGRVAPLRYGQMSLEELCRTLGRDHRVWVLPDRQSASNVVASFATDRTLTRREVLEALAREADCDLRIGYCGTGATFLFGAHPSFTRLLSRSALPSGLATDPQPMRPATNGTPLLPGAAR